MGDLIVALVFYKRVLIYDMSTKKYFYKEGLYERIKDRNALRNINFQYIT